MIALASEPAARYPDASSFAFAARRAVFPRGRSLLTGLPGLRRATRENSVLSRPKRLSRADEPTHPLSPRATRAIWAVPDVKKGQTGRPQLTARTLFVAVAATALVVMLCGAASLSLARQMNLPILGFAPTATIRPTATLEPTATPVPTETPTPIPTATLVPPIPKLIVSAFTWTKSGGGACLFIGTMNISNPGGGKSMGWNWVEPISPNTPTSFRWGPTSPPTGRGNLPAQGLLAPGSTYTLYISLVQACSGATTTYSVTMVDTNNRSYPITFTPQ